MQCPVRHTNGEAIWSQGNPGLCYPMSLRGRVTDPAGFPQSCLYFSFSFFPLFNFVFDCIVPDGKVRPTVHQIEFIPGLGWKPWAWQRGHVTNAASCVQQEATVECDHFTAAMLAVNRLFLLSPLWLSCCFVVSLITWPGPEHLLVAAGGQEGNKLLVWNNIWCV